ncbi:macrophage mannose receptor 1-like [Penaeus monodon]|uniref:macrophage mannose receptor 1-like n=1 Tax=Penaeus monodon TaxID=6687 RepID=UPI0018A75DC8|nr:macrophage mannose receptor 1-like [Penaeus monodon]
MKMRPFIALAFAVGLAGTVAGQACNPPFTLVGSKCVYLETTEEMSWQEARDYCMGLGSDTGVGDLATFPICDDYVAFARYLALNAPINTTMWMGALTLFAPNTWQWVTGEDLQTGVPFWYYNEDYSETEKCAAADGSYYYRLINAHCDLAKNFVCEISPMLEGQEAKVVSDPEALVDPACHDHGIVIGDFCYVFYQKEEPWEIAEEKCRTSHHEQGGELYYPSGCHEFTHMAHHLEAAENTNSYWVGGVDISGNEEWTWVNGENIPGGPPYWATGEPSHSHDNEPREHCTVMTAEKRYYLQDVHCADAHPYICKLGFF